MVLKWREVSLLDEGVLNRRDHCTANIQQKKKY